MPGNHGTCQYADVSRFCEGCLELLQHYVRYQAGRGAYRSRACHANPNWENPVSLHFTCTSLSEILDRGRLYRTAESTTPFLFLQIVSEGITNTIVHGHGHKAS